MPGDVEKRYKSPSRASRNSGQAEILEHDAEILAEIGYKQDLKRDWSLLHSFGISFSIISVITGITTLFEFGLTTGGPGVMSVGWIVVSAMTMLVAISMAEITSAIPTSGDESWPQSRRSSILTSSLFTPLFLGFCTIGTGMGAHGFLDNGTGISFGCANLISTLAAAHGFNVTAAKTLGIYAALLFSHGVVNTFGVRTLRYLNNSSIIFHSLGVFSIVVATLAKAPTHQSAKFVFATFYDGTGVDGVGWGVRASDAYVAICGILLTQYTITGFDASAHMSEETKNASTAAPMGVLMSVGASAVFGFFVLVSFLFCIQDFDTTVASDVGQPVLQILIDVFGLGGATGIFVIIIICVWHCGLFSLTSNSRMMYAFARDRGIFKWFDHVDPRFSSPWRTIWLAALLAFLLAVPSLGSSVAFSAATSIATIGLYISYAIPIACGVIDQKHFKKGPFDLGKLSRPIGLAACLWVGFITIVFCLPTLNPVDSQTLNYTPVAVGIVALWAFGSWFLFARKYFTGPIRQIDLDHTGGVQGHIRPGHESDSVDKEPIPEEKAPEEPQHAAPTS